MCLSVSPGGLLVVFLCSFLSLLQHSPCLPACGLPLLLPLPPAVQSLLTCLWSSFAPLPPAAYSLAEIPVLDIGCRGPGQQDLLLAVPFPKQRCACIWLALYAGRAQPVLQAPLPSASGGAIVGGPLPHFYGRLVSTSLLGRVLVLKADRKVGQSLHSLAGELQRCMLAQMSTHACAYTWSSQELARTNCWGALAFAHAMASELRAPFTM